MNGLPARIKRKGSENGEFMITIFRRIRQRFFAEKNISRYILYATGEIILVVIGILIALQINNWNENRKAQIAQKDLLINFYENLEADSLILQENRWVMLSIIENHRQLQAVRKGEIWPAELANPESIRRSIRNYSITQTNHPDIAIPVFNKKLKEQIRQYYRLLAFLDNSNRKYDTVVRDFRPRTLR